MWVELVRNLTAKQSVHINYIASIKNDNNDTQLLARFTDNAFKFTRWRNCLFFLINNKQDKFSNEKDSALLDEKTWINRHPPYVQNLSFSSLSYLWFQRKKERQSLLTDDSHESLLVALERGHGVVLVLCTNDHEFVFVSVPPPLPSLLLLLLLLLHSSATPSECPPAFDCSCSCRLTAPSHSSVQSLYWPQSN